MIFLYSKKSLNSPYITLSSDNKTIEVPFQSFDFDLGNIIPSLYGNSIYSINIISFINKKLKTEIIKDSIDNKEYQDLFLITNNIDSTTPIIIKFIIPDKKIEKKECVEVGLDFKILSEIPNEINSLVLTNKIKFNLLPLSAIIYSKKYNFSWNENKLILNMKYLDEGHSLKINFKIMNFEGKNELFENSYSLISLEGNNIDKSKVKLESEDSFATLKKIKITKMNDISKKYFSWIVFNLFKQKFNNPN